MCEHAVQTRAPLAGNANAVAVVTPDPHCNDQGVYSYIHIYMYVDIYIYI